ncbi:MAG: hypothetical protein HQM04_15285, partial [Magnetococcales bacterium]|nr:hypothetical protein [Magnetococcales bacterium]MBF0116389.1 hypothetical protein [Magnetococcales bacterium]
MSVLSYLEGRASQAVLQQTEKDSIERSIKTLRARLDSNLGEKISEQIQFGSSTRGTILPRRMDSESDIDYMVRFNDSQYTPQTYLNWLKRFALSSYSKSEVLQSNPVIVLELNHIKFELVPAVLIGGVLKITSLPTSLQTKRSGGPCESVHRRQFA